MNNSINNNVSGISCIFEICSNQLFLSDSYNSFKSVFSSINERFFSSNLCCSNWSEQNLLSFLLLFLQKCNVITACCWARINPLNKNKKTQLLCLETAAKINFKIIECGVGQTHHNSNRFSMRGGGYDRFYRN